MALVDQFLADKNGKALDFDGVYGAQCVDSVAFFCRDYLDLPVFYADAARWFNDFAGSPLEGSYDRITNDPNDANQHPQANDLIIWAASLAGSGGAGHIAIYKSPASSGFVSVDQNWNGKYVHEVTHNWSGVIGWLHPHSQGEDMADLIDTNISRVVAHGILGRNAVAGRAYALDGSAGDPWVGGELTAQFLMDVFNSPEAKQWRDSNDPDSVNGVNARLADQAKAIADLTHKLEISQATNPNSDATKWQALRVVLKDLLK